MYPTQLQSIGTTNTPTAIQRPSQTKAGIIPAVSTRSTQTTRSALTPYTVLLEAPFDPLRRQMNSVLLTVDLTKAVVDEAIERNDSVIVSYRSSSTSASSATPAPRPNIAQA